MFVVMESRSGTALYVPQYTTQTTTIAIMSDTCLSPEHSGMSGTSSQCAQSYTLIWKISFLMCSSWHKQITTTFISRYTNITLLVAYANWVNETQIPGYCQGYGYTDERETECMDTWNPNNKIFTDRSVNNSILLQWQCELNMHI